MKLTKDILKKIIGAIHSTQPREIDCGDCFDRMNQFAELELAGKSAAQAMPLVRAHLKRCPCCRAEYEALLTAMQQLEKSE